MIRRKLIRVTTVPISMNIIMKGQLRFMNRYFDVVGVSSYVEKDVKEIEEREGIRMHAVNISRRISPLRDLFALIRLYKLFKAERPSIVHTHTPKAGLLGMVASYLARVPVRLHTVAGLPVVERRGLTRLVLLGAERLTYACAHKVYPNSKGLYQIIIRNRLCPSRKLSVILNGSSNGIDVDHFSPKYSENASQLRCEVRRTLGIGEQDFVFCFVGRLAREKGINELVNAFLRLSKCVARRNSKLLLIGPLERDNGELGNGLIMKINQNPDILHPGRFDDVRPYLLSSDTFVFPSYREGFPNAVLQAAAMGLPCLVSDINGCNEIIQQNVNGLIFQPKSTDSLFDAMRVVLIDDVLRENMRKRSRETVINRFHQSSIWEEWLGEYNTMTNQLSG